VAGVGEEGERVGEQTCRNLDDGEASDERERRRERASIGSKALSVIVSVHRFSSCPFAVMNPKRRVNRIASKNVLRSRRNDPQAALAGTTLEKWRAPLSR
jgi:hypothetical protein